MLFTAALLIGTITSQSASSSKPDDHCAKTLQSVAKESRAVADIRAAEAQYIQTNGDFSPSLKAEFIRWYDKARSGRPTDYPPLTATVLTSGEQKQLQAAMDEFLQFRNARFEREAAARFERSISACPHRADELRAMMSEAVQGN